jgi:ATP-independent RNA helicase DbpA
MVQKILDNFKIESLNNMQLAVIEAAKTSTDILLLSPTGSGKTLGFFLPVLGRLDPENSGVQTLVLVPSRELAIQVERVFKQMNTGFKVLCCYGGHPTKTEKKSFAFPPAVVIGTPGRIAFHIRENSFATNSIHTLILDEFDKSLEFGFKEEMSFIISNLKKLSKRILTSATTMAQIPSFTGVKEPVELNFLDNSSPVSISLTLKYLRSGDHDKTDILLRLICALQNKPALVFCNHRDAVERLFILLTENNLSAGTFHGGMEQEDRERELIKFRNGTHRVLITTDLASRGLDIPEVEAIIHYQLPPTLEIFTHRNGRTARMNASGTAYLLLSLTDHLPTFLTEIPQEEVLPEKIVLPERTPWQTLFIAAGKKEKISKMDIVGMLLQKGNLAKEDLGLVEVLDHSSYAAVNSSKIDSVLKLIRNEKIKNQRVRFYL